MFNEETTVMEGKIHPDYRKKVILKLLLRVPLYSLFYFVIFIQFGLSIFFYEEFSVALFNMIVWYFIFVAIILLMAVVISMIYYNAYMRRFLFEITDSNIIINHGVFRQSRETIPYTRVQNISITNTILDRKYNIYSVNIETAGGSGSAYSYGRGRRRRPRPEGFIPGQKEPLLIEQKIRDMLYQTAGIIKKTKL